MKLNEATILKLQKLKNSGVPDDMIMKKAAKYHLFPIHIFHYVYYYYCHRMYGFQRVYQNPIYFRFMAACRGVKPVKLIEDPQEIFNKMLQCTTVWIDGEPPPERWKELAVYNVLQFRRRGWNKHGRDPDPWVTMINLALDSRNPTIHRVITPHVIKTLNLLKNYQEENEPIEQIFFKLPIKEISYDVIRSIEHRKLIRTAVFRGIRK
jgi:hypothetical protein